MSEKKSPQDHPLANILINVIIPVLILSYLSKDPELQERLGKVARPWQIGPLKAMILALALPLGYGVWHFIKTRKGNFFSALGLISVLLSGGLTLYLWNANGTVKPRFARAASHRHGCRYLRCRLARCQRHGGEIMRTLL